MRSTCILAGCLCLALSGCAESGAPSGGGDSGAARTVRPENLPELAGSLPPLDDGRLEIRLPADWKPGPREEGFIARLQFQGAEQYPVILIAADDHAGGTVDDLLQAVSATLAAEEAKLAVEPQRLAFEGFEGVEYLRRAKTATHELERMVVVRALGTRRYSLELRALRGTTARFRPYLLAIARGLQPPTAAAPLGEPASEETSDSGGAAGGEPPTDGAPAAPDAQVPDAAPASEPPAPGAN